MAEGLVIGACVGFGASLLLLIGVVAGQLSVWRWLHKRYGVSWGETFFDWLDRQLEERDRYAKGWQDFTDALDEVGRETDD